MSDVEDSPAGSPPPESPRGDARDDEPKDPVASDVEAADDSGKDSEDEDDDLSEIDEGQFGDYDPSAAQIKEKQPVEIDEDVAKTLKAGKRKGQAVKKPKEGRRDKKKRGREDDNDGADGEIMTGKRVRKTGTTEAKKAASPEPVNEADLTPEERRRRAIERASNKDFKKPTKRRKKQDEDDLENELDERIAELKAAMETACDKDQSAREKGLPAVHKLKLLPEVMALLNRNTMQSAIVDPEHNFLLGVRYFLEPLGGDGSLPAYNIQRDIFTALSRLSIDQDALSASGLGKVVLFYTKSKKPEIGIKRMADKLLAEWSRPILKRSDDYKQRHVETRDFDFKAAKLRQEASSSQFSLTQRPAASQQALRDAERERILAPTDDGNNRARVTGLPSSYSIAPKSTWDASVRNTDHRPIGAKGHEAFRKLTQKGKRN